MLNESLLNQSAPRVICNGKIAVICRSMPGKGWYSVHRQSKLLFSPAIVDMILRNCSSSKIYNFCLPYKELEIYSNHFYKNLKIKWVKQGEEFRIHEEDGKEEVILKANDNSWFQSNYSGDNPLPCVIRNHAVAVIYATKRGDSWYSWHQVDELLFSPAIVDMIERGGNSLEIYEYCVENFSHDIIDMANFEDLDIGWVKLGESFRIQMKNGVEEIVYKRNEQYFRA